MTWETTATPLRDTYDHGWRGRWFESITTSITTSNEPPYTVYYPVGSIGAQKAEFSKQISELLEKGFEYPLFKNGTTLEDGWSFSEFCTDLKLRAEDGAREEAERREWLADFDELLGGGEVRG